MSTIHILHCQLCGTELGEHERLDFCQRCLHDPFPEDTRLRRGGWRIISRYKVIAIWGKNDSRLTFDNALESLPEPESRSPFNPTSSRNSK